MRMGHLLAAAGLSLAAVAGAAPAPAQAQAGPPPLCFTEFDLMKVGASIRAYAFRSCDDDPPTGLAVALERRDPATGSWHRVAEGIGEARFTCFGTGLRTYRHAKQPDLTLTANCT
jgi:hypothetical protein